MPTIKEPPEVTNDTTPLSGSWTTLASAAGWKAIQMRKMMPPGILYAWQTIDTGTLPLFQNDPRQISGFSPGWVNTSDER
jgi:hypothetical protein